jgi:hypothetical protein
MNAQEAATQEIVSKWQDRPFQIGTDDCAHLIMEMRAALGAPITFKGGGIYSTEMGALRVLKKLGYDDLEQACDAMLGERLETPLFAAMGDVVMFPGEGALNGGLGLALNDGRIFIPAGPDGETAIFRALGHVDPVTGQSMCLAAWRLV